MTFPDPASLGYVFTCACGATTTSMAEARAWADEVRMARYEKFTRAPVWETLLINGSSLAIGVGIMLFLVWKFS